MSKLGAMIRSPGRNLHPQSARVLPGPRTEKKEPVATLRDQLGHGDKRASVIKDANDVLEMEVQDKGGLTGVAIRGAFAIVKGVKPGFTTEVIDHLLNDFLDALDPIYQEAVAQGARPSAHLAGNR